MSDIIFGIHSVSEALKSRERSFDYIAIAKDRTDPRIQRIIDEVEEFLRGAADSSEKFYVFGREHGFRRSTPLFPCGYGAVPDFAEGRFPIFGHEGGV